MTHSQGGLPLVVAITLGAFVLGGCSGGGAIAQPASSSTLAPAVAPIPAEPPAAPEKAEARGADRLDASSVIEAGEGDDLASLAARAGVSTEALAAYNGVWPTWRPPVGARLAVPPT